VDLQLIDAERLPQVVTMGEAVSALERAFAEQAPGIPDRQHLDVGGGDLLVMPAWSRAAAGTKLVTVAPGNPERGLPLIHGVYVLFDKPALRPVALFDAAPLTALRTAAVSAVATRHLARSDSRYLVVFGAGVQARAHVEAMSQVLDLDRVGIVSRTPKRAEELAGHARSLGLEADVVTPAAVGQADVICTCTTSAEPLFDGDLPQGGVHINAVGSYRRDARELDDRSIERADLVCADTAAALRESGDLATPLDNGRLDRGQIGLLSDVLDGPGRSSPHDITIFKSVGAAFQDLAVAEAAAARL
jgi:ornithine cyclodeaminase